MPDDDHSTPSLGASDSSAVHHPVGPPIPETFQSQENCSQVSSSVAGQKPVDIFENRPSGSGCVNETKVFVDESLELPVETGVFTCESDAPLAGADEIFAREAA